MSKNIVNRLLTTFLLLIAIILAQDMTQKYSRQGLTIRIERPKSRVVNTYSAPYPVGTRKNYMSKKPEPTERIGLVTSLSH